ncbi:hypothetical protein BpHYR1_043130 [Brachionus plicatilis]|uniref:Uncharacterized protein n=1 Tax=Brachionus plicatilis TaxID=10195 RepID=A0A3M7Q107_BRAPC|nr:hypothetical protein BpHYR1_043130 [Brachionus plicatilis]
MTHSEKEIADLLHHDDLKKSRKYLIYNLVIFSQILLLITSRNKFFCFNTIGFLENKLEMSFFLEQGLKFKSSGVKKKTIILTSRSRKSSNLFPRSEKKTIKHFKTLVQHKLISFLSNNRKVRYHFLYSTKKLFYNSNNDTINKTKIDFGVQLSIGFEISTIWAYYNNL